MSKAPKRGSNIVIKTQFNINGSRGKNVGGFVANYVARDAATDTSLAYVPPIDRPFEQGDGVAFTLTDTAISKQETLGLASEVETLHAEGNRAIQQLVISFKPSYLVEQGLVPNGIPIMHKGDYRYNYDDVRLRHAVIAGISAMIENEGYYDGNMVAAIQSDTLHLHVHAVVYERSDTIARKRGNEEKGMLKDSSLGRLSHHIHRHLTSTRDSSVVPTQRLLTPEYLDTGTTYTFVTDDFDMDFLNRYLELLQEQERQDALLKSVSDELVDTITNDIDLIDDIEQ